MAEVDAKGATSIEQKLRNLYDLQQVDTRINKIEKLSGELPEEIKDLEDELEGKNTRIANLKAEVEAKTQDIATKKQEIIDAQAKIKEDQEKQNNVRNNREYDSLLKEIEYQELEVQLCEKRIREYTAEVESKKEAIANLEVEIAERAGDLEQKKSELSDIVSENEKEVAALKEKAAEIEKLIDAQYLNAYRRIKSNARNGLAVVTVQRDACGGCFNKIPPQRKVDIRTRKQIIVCEYCGRILVDDGFNAENENAEA